MNIEEYRTEAQKVGYREHLTYTVASEQSLESFLDYTNLDLDLKIHLSKVILCRHFMSTGETILPADIYWFIRNFLSEFETDFIKPWISAAVKHTIEMIISGDTFSKQIIGTTFLFGVIEFNIKYRLGYRPEKYHTFDNYYHQQYRRMFLGPALNKLKKTNSLLACDLNEIDQQNIKALKLTGIAEKNFVITRMADRLTFARNIMIHGESHSFYNTGIYLTMIYILFHFHCIKDGTKYEGI
ncbi:MAG: hypothetical protein HOP08_00680 [Cyclobacteriaceae bacterium]|nr:hypothetical protein [Cyclobacteriaceae bacterium]